MDLQVNAFIVEPAAKAFHSALGSGASRHFSRHVGQVRWSTADDATGQRGQPIQVTAGLTSGPWDIGD